MLSILNRSSYLDPVSAENIEQVFHWAMENFDAGYFEQETLLIQPIRDYFPDKANNEFDMAKALCARILAYMGISDWPFSLVAPQQLSPNLPPLLQLDIQSRRKQGETKQEVAAQAVMSMSHEMQENRTLEISYSSAMMKKPMDLVGAMSKNIAQHYLHQSQFVAPTGPESFDSASEILAIFMGFGIFIANSAYTFRGSCAKCYDPRANRSAALNENEAIYALALFCHHKKIENKKVTPSLKSYLRSDFKKARKQVERRL